MLKSLLPSEVRVIMIIDDIILRPNLATNKTRNLTRKSSLHTTLSFTQSHSGVLGDIEIFVQKIPGSYKSEKLNNITGIDEIHIKCDYIHGSIVKKTTRTCFLLFCAR